MRSLRKRMHTWSGVYLIKNVVNNKIYVGSTKNLKHRKYQHFNLLRNGKHYNYLLQKDFNTYGESNFSFELCCLCLEQALIPAEQQFIDKYASYDKTVGYNIQRYANKTFYTNVPKGESNKQSKSYVVLDPEGNKLDFTGMHAFCQKK